MSAEHTQATKEQIERARAEYARGSDDNIEIDNDAQVSGGGGAGVWVQAWVWLPNEVTV